MWFFTSLYRSLFDLRWLKEQKDKFSASWSYFFLFIFLLSGLMIIPVFLQLPSGLKELRVLAEKNLPDFKAEWKGGQLNITNLEQPYILKDNGFVMVVDTVTTADLQLKNWLSTENPSGVLVTKDRVEVYDSKKGNSRTQYWKDVPDYSTSKSELLVKADKWLSPLMMYLAGLVIFLGLFIGLTISKLFTLLIVTVIVLMINNFAKKGWNFKQLFSVGLFSLTLPSILIVALSWMGGRISLLYSLILLGVMLGIVFLKENKEIIS